MFENMKNILTIRYVDLSNLGLGKVHENMFANLPYLQTLKLNDNPNLGQTLGFTGLFRNDRVQNLKHLHLVNVGLSKHIIDLIIWKITGVALTTLILDQNRISGMRPGIHRLRHLEVFSISGNQMSSPTDLIAELLELQHLRYLNLSRQNRDMLFPIHPVKSSKRNRRDDGHEYPPVWIQHLCSRKFNRACMFPLPPNLTHLDLSYSGFQMAIIPKLVLSNNNSLNYVYLSSNSIRFLPEPFYCPLKVKPAIHFVDLSSNSIECINSSYFEYCDWAALNVLDLSGNKLQNAFENYCNTNLTYFLNFLKPLWNLTRLDLSGNMIKSNLSFNSFGTQHNLRELYLSKMEMKNFTVKLQHMDKLKLLDISYNNLGCLSKELMLELNNLSHAQKRIHNNSILNINLSKNPLQCNCQCYPFLKWFKNMDFIFTNKDNTNCMISGKIYAFSDIDKIITKVEKMCFPQTWLYIYIEVTVGWIAFVSFITLIIRYKYKIFFFYLQWRTSLLYELLAEEEKEFHAFVSFSEKDRNWMNKRLLRNLEQRMNLKLHAAARDFEVSRLIHDNIWRAINRSVKTVFVISKNFLRSDWCLEEFAMALHVRIQNFIFPPVLV